MQVEHAGEPTGTITSKVVVTLVALYRPEKVAESKPNLVVLLPEYSARWRILSTHLVDAFR